MRVIVNCPRRTFVGDRTTECGCAIEVEAEVSKLALIPTADSVELPAECFYGHRFDQEEVTDLRNQINAAVDRVENTPVEMFDFPEFEDIDPAGAA